MDWFMDNQVPYRRDLRRALVCRGETAHGRAITFNATIPDIYQIMVCPSALPFFFLPICIKVHIRYRLVYGADQKVRLFSFVLTPGGYKINSYLMLRLWSSFTDKHGQIFIQSICRHWIKVNWCINTVFVCLSEWTGMKEMKHVRCKPC